jgi:cell division protein FtsN
MVRVGFSDRDRAAALAKQLVAGGFSQTNVTSRKGFRVVSEPLPRSVADGLVATLAGRGFHSQVEPLAGDTAQLVFGSFSSQKEAEALSQRITTAGYDAWVREVAVYTLQLGPYPQSSVNTITGIIKSGAPEATVAADPVAPQTSPPPAPAVPQASPAPAAPKVSPPPATSASQVTTSQPSAPSSGSSNRPVMVQAVLSDRDRASAIANQLAGRGFHSQIEPLVGDTVQLVFGSFTVQKEAETLAQRIGAAGYDAWVREGAVYTLQLGQYPQSSVNTITGIIKSGAPEATVTVVPAP